MMHTDVENGGILVLLNETKSDVLGDACADCLVQNLAKSLLI